MAISANVYNFRYAAVHVKQLQRDLNDAGHNAGALDGKLGPKTRRAMQRAIANG